MMSILRAGTLLVAVAFVGALGPACDGKSKLLIGGTGGSLGTSDSGLGGASVAPDALDDRDASSDEEQRTLDSASCDGSALVGRWYRPLDGLIMLLDAKGCAITGTSDNVSYSHAIVGTYDDVARTMIGTIKRTNISSGCITVMNATWVLINPTHFTLTITGTDGRCDLLKTYSEFTTFVRQ